MDLIDFLFDYHQFRSVWWCKNWPEKYEAHLNLTMVSEKHMFPELAGLAVIFKCY